MSKLAAIDAARRAAILAGAPVVPKGTCHFCGYDRIPKRALWCCADCVKSYEAEKRSLSLPPVAT
jgi:hypothetical protein